MIPHDAGAFVLQVSGLRIESPAVREGRPLSARLRPLYVREQTPPARSPTANLDLEIGIHIEVAFGRLQAKDAVMGLSQE